MVNVGRGCNVLFKSEEDVTCRSNFVLVMHIYAISCSLLVLAITIF